MKAETLRRFLAVHSAVGMCAGLLLFIAFYAGALTLFREPIQAWAMASAPTRAAPPKTLDDAQRLLDNVLAREPAMAADIRVYLPHEGGDLQVAGPDPRTRHWREFELGPDGQVRPHEEHTDLADFIYRLHYTAGLPRPWGTYVLGVVCLLYGLALVSGVVIYMPMLARDLFALRWGRNIKRLWQDAHNAVGLLSLPFHVVFAWSGAVLTIGTLLLAPFQFFVFDGKLLDLVGPQAGFSRPVAQTDEKAPLLSLARLVAAAQAAAPGLEVERLHIRKAGSAQAHVETDGHLQQRHLSDSARIELNGATGELLHAQTPSNYSSGTALLRGLQTLHFGDYGGLVLRWVYCLLSLGGAFLFYSGNLLWVESRRKHRQPEQLRRAGVMARLTLGVCLGCMAGISALFLLTRIVGEPRLSPWLEAAYLAVLGSCVLWAFARPLPRAAVELCVASAAVTAAIAGADMAMFDAQRLLGDATLWATDLTALAGAAMLLAIARATRRRARSGPAYSVWATAA
ncbi:PepSY-associated TM helix domain-containing protein [Roseateles cellulosilyticus]|uniref:PepSY domain-containing protein n=1 Tax=Pelomonas cellulosilytica TaxID=2906762 RepID=A0ABS8XW49_9BURK|nr:PepSY-associated TM helix domain-containing protein [Pelomonas sp. P8]MCE4553530.1 PepSY domain-containing protein [Pelomonas sp. P8]